jgi:hypothetical protein
MSKKPMPARARQISPRRPVACKEARETHYWLRLIAASSLITAARLEPLTKECDELVAILTTIVKKTRAGAKKGEG